MSKEIFIKMREEEYSEIPNEIKERYFNAKNVTTETNDWAENMKDVYFSNTYLTIKRLKKELAEREYQLRENRRKKI